MAPTILQHVGGIGFSLIKIFKIQQLVKVLKIENKSSAEVYIPCYSVLEGKFWVLEHGCHGKWILSCLFCL